MLKKKNIKTRRFGIFISLTAYLVGMMTCDVFAEVDDAVAGQYKNFYLNNSRSLQPNNFVEAAIRTIGWKINRWMANLADTCQHDVYDKAYSFIDITTWAPINDFISSFRPIFVGLVALGLLYFAYKLISDPNYKPRNFVDKITIIVLCLSCSTAALTTLNSWTKDFKAALELSTTTTEATTIIDNDILDIAKNWNKNGANMAPDNYIFGGVVDDDSVDILDINEVINPTNTKLVKNGSEAFKYYINGMSSSNSPMYEEVSKGIGSSENEGDRIGNTYYYRFDFEFVNCFIELFALCLLYLAMGYKCVRIAIELVFGRLFAMLLSSDITSGEKVKKALVFVKDSYILLCTTAIVIKIYGFVSMWLGQGGLGLTGLLKDLFTLFLAFTLIDGPNLVEQLIGMDVGLKSSTARWMAAGRVATGAAKGAAATVGGLISGQDNKNSISNNKQTEQLLSQLGENRNDTTEKDNITSDNSKTFNHDSQGGIGEKDTYNPTMQDKNNKPESNYNTSFMDDTMHVPGNSGKEQSFMEKETIGINTTYGSSINNQEPSSIDRSIFDKPKEKNRKSSGVMSSDKL